MNNLIQASGQFELQDFQRELRWYRLRNQRSLFILMGIIFLMGIANFFTGAPFPFVILLIASPLLVVTLALNSLKNSAKRATLSTGNRPVEYTFDLMGYEIKTNSSLVKNEWDNLHSVKENDASFLLFPQPNFFQVVPKRFFDDEQSVAELREIMRVRLGSKAVLKQLN